MSFLLRLSLYSCMMPKFLTPVAKHQKEVRETAVGHGLPNALSFKPFFAIIVDQNKLKTQDFAKMIQES